MYRCRRHHELESPIEDPWKHGQPFIGHDPKLPTAHRAWIGQRCHKDRQGSEEKEDAENDGDPPQDEEATRVHQDEGHGESGDPGYKKIWYMVPVDLVREAQVVEHPIREIVPWIGEREFPRRPGLIECWYGIGQYAGSSHKVGRGQRT